jgi:hypothetical protein
MRIISIDVGLKTCSFCVEDYDDEITRQVVFPPKKERYNKDGSATEPMVEAIRQVSIVGQILFLEKKDLGDKKDYFSGEAFMELHTWLFDLFTRQAFNEVNVIVIEQQMNTNFIALALMHHIFAWCLIQFQQTIPVVLFPSRNKTRILGMQLKKEDSNENTSKYARKKWSWEQVDLLLQQRQDQLHHNLIFVENKAKKDDLADTINQSRAYLVQQLLK